ncbi:hypothetical protein SAMN03159422_02833 [Agrobacterium fabrum]|uniref:hypothetical protein n=1 Tax=Agrobacterium fabrum TaxID=1176649 RepID=UPI00087F6CF5|nr:hypothetical protein [Agrobacterium fabrum]MDH6297078.1 hypothetical protein [Agrobacterium fabrum]SDB65751.1 hypothetical protein SAMN03159422_02833 [Agrobacterium fabrum]SER40911.1 hypothetical protein SAMN03159504_02834 [Agrobacterium fabrum]
MGSNAGTCDFTAFVSYRTLVRYDAGEVTVRWLLILDIYNIKMFLFKLWGARENKNRRGCSGGLVLLSMTAVKRLRQTVIA